MWTLVGLLQGYGPELNEFLMFGIRRPEQIDESFADNYAYTFFASAAEVRAVTDANRLPLTLLGAWFLTPR